MINMSERLSYLKQVVRHQKNSDVVMLRISDAEWAISEMERLEIENKRLEKVIDSASESVGHLLENVRK